MGPWCLILRTLGALMSSFIQSNSVSAKYSSGIGRHFNSKDHFDFKRRTFVPGLSSVGKMIQGYFDEMMNLIDGV